MSRGLGDVYKRQHADVPREIREQNGITESTLRLSVGIENIKDLLGELEQVFNEIEDSLKDGTAVIE